MISNFRTSGCVKVLYPRTDETALTAITLNTAGGVTGGDRVQITAEALANSHLRLSTQAAERLYRAQLGEIGHVTTDLTIGDDARIDWLPQETIVFNQSALDRSLRVQMASTGRFLMVEPLVFGRVAMGETVQQAQLTDRIKLYRDGTLIFADTLLLSGDVQRHLNQPTIAQGAGAMASVLLATTDHEAEVLLPRIRDMLPDTAGASLLKPGLLYLRFLAQDSFTLRHSLVPVLTVLNGAPLPRTWMI